MNRVDDLGGTSVPFNKGRMELHAQHSGPPMPPLHKSMPPLHNGHRESSEELPMVRLDTDGNVPPYDQAKPAWERLGRNVVAARRAQA